MVTSGEVLSLATLRGAIMGKIRLLWVFRSLEYAFAIIPDLKMLTDTDRYTKPHVKFMYFYANIFIYHFPNPKLYSI